MDTQNQGCILLVEDDIELNKIIYELIQSSGNYVVIQCFNGQSALELLIDRGLRPDLVLCDINLPELSGINLVQQQLAKNLNLNICFMSADDSSQNMLQALQLGAIDFISKPIDFTDILDKIPRLVQMGKNRAKLLSEIANDPEASQMNKEVNLFRVINSISKNSA